MTGSHPAPAAGGSALLLILLLGGCTDASRPLDDGEKIVRETLALLVSDGRPVCVDRHTHGRPLNIFRTMLSAPMPARRMLGWRPPTTLRPPPEPSDGAVYRDSVRDERLRLAEPGDGPGLLPPLEQRRFNSVASVLSARGQLDQVRISDSWGVAGVTARWWPFNRVARDCAPTFRISDPVHSPELGFVTVTAGHWGVTYALEKRGAAWRPTAQWSRWLY